MYRNRIRTPRLTRIDQRSAEPRSFSTCKPGCLGLTANRSNASNVFKRIRSGSCASPFSNSRVDLNSIASGQRFLQISHSRERVCRWLQVCQKKGQFLLGADETVVPQNREVHNLAQRPGQMSQPPVSTLISELARAVEQPAGTVDIFLQPIVEGVKLFDQVSKFGGIASPSERVAPDGVSETLQNPLAPLAPNECSLGFPNDPCHVEQNSEATEMTSWVREAPFQSEQPHLLFKKEKFHTSHVDRLRASFRRCML